MSEENNVQEYVDGTDMQLVEDTKVEIEVTKNYAPEDVKVEEPTVSVKEVKKSKDELKHEELNHIRDEENRIFSALKNPDYEVLVSSCYTEMDAMTEMAIEGISYGALIEGSGGTGKSYRTLNMALNKLGEGGVSYTDSFTTPQSLYCWFYKGIRQQKKLFIVDDVAGFMNNDKILAFIKGFAWDINGKRLMHYMTTKPLQDDEGHMVPNVVDCSGASIIIITNKLNQKNPHIQAVLSRINYCYVDVPRDELLEILKKIIQKDYRTLKFYEREEVLNYLIDNTSNSTENLNIRTMFKMFQFKEYANRHHKGDIWKTLSLKLFKKDDALALVESLLKDDKFVTENERITEFMNLTKKSKATYYNLKEQLNISKKKNKIDDQDRSENQY